MKDPRTIEGMWWIHGDAGEPSQGTLRFEPEDDILLSIHMYSPPDSKLPPMFDLGNMTCVHCIHGLDEHGQPVTLFGCSVGNVSSTSRARHVTIHAIAVIAGMGLNSWEESRFRAARLKFSLLHNWVNSKRIKKGVSAKSTLSIEIQPTEDLILTLPDGVKVRLSSDFASHSSLVEESFQFSHSLYFHFQNAVSADAISSKWAMTVQYLLTLLTGERIFIDDFVLFEQDPYEANQSSPATRATLLRSCRGIKHAVRDRSAHHMVTKFQDLLSDLPAIVNKWFALDETLKPVVDLFMLVRSQSAPTIEMRFLVLAQALEAFHSRAGGFTGSDMPRAEHRTRISALVACVPPEHQAWMRDKLAYANQKTLSTRLTEIFAQHQAEVTVLTVGIPDFATKVKNTRNYYTHYGEELLEDGKVAKDAELIKITFALEAILGVCLLKEIGIHGMPIERFVNRYREIGFTQITQPKS